MFNEQFLNIKLQIILMMGCFFTYWYILRKVKKSNVRIEDIIIWIIGVIILFIFCIVPAIPFSVANLLGFDSTVNIIFFLVIFFLFIMTFLLTIRLSQTQEKVKELTHKIAIENYQVQKGKEMEDTQ